MEITQQELERCGFNKTQPKYADANCSWFWYTKDIENSPLSGVMVEFSAASVAVQLCVKSSSIQLRHIRTMEQLAQFWKLVTGTELESK